MTKEEFAALLNGREYGREITKAEATEAKALGLVVVFGYSDDNVELRGAIVALTTELVRRNGGDTNLQVTIDGGESRDIIIGPAKEKEQQRAH